MSNTLSGVTLEGITYIGSDTGSDYVERLRIGGGTPGHATAASSLYVGGVCEVDSAVYVDGGLVLTSASDIGCASNTADAIEIGPGSGGAVTALLTLDTTTDAEQLELACGLELSAADGVTNIGGGTGSIRQPEYLRVALSDASSAAGGVASLKNPFGEHGWAEMAVVYVTTASTAAATIDVGVDSDGSTGDDKLIDGLDVNSATGLFDYSAGGGANGLIRTAWTSTQYLVASQASGDVTGLDGYLYVWFHPIGS